LIKRNVKHRVSLVNKECVWRKDCRITTCIWIDLNEGFAANVKETQTRSLILKVALNEDNIWIDGRPIGCSDLYYILQLICFDKNKSVLIVGNCNKSYFIDIVDYCNLVPLRNKHQLNISFKLVPSRILRTD
jgi:hypothetical protein